MSSHKKHGKRRTRKGSGDALILAGRHTGAKLAFCGVILAVCTAVKIIAPTAYGAISTYLSGSVDLRAAFGAVGEGIGGEAPITEALAEACRYAFTTVREATPQEDAVPASAEADAR